MLNRRELLQAIGLGCLVPGIHITTSLSAPIVRGELAACATVTEVVTSKERTFTGPCELARKIKELMDATGVNLGQIAEALDSFMTSQELRKRMSLLALPRDLQDDLDAGNMKLMNAYFITQDHAPKEIWEQCKTASWYEVKKLVELRQMQLLVLEESPISDAEKQRIKAMLDAIPTKFPIGIHHRSGACIYGIQTRRD